MDFETAVLKNNLWKIMTVRKIKNENSVICFTGASVAPNESIQATADESLRKMA